MLKTWFMPTVMVRNEERFIAQVLRPLIAVCGEVMLGDTGSNDATVDIASAIPGVHIVEYGVSSLEQLTAIRKDLGNRVAEMGCKWQLLCDGDELYAHQALQEVANFFIPEDKVTGFTTMISVDEFDDGVWEMEDLFSRQAIFPSRTIWHGTYPFDVPDQYRDPSKFFYFRVPDGYRYHALHLHRMRRSGKDDEVILRTYKQKKYSLNDVERPRTRPFDMEAWCHQ